MFSIFRWPTSYNFPLFLRFPSQNYNRTSHHDFLEVHGDEHQLALYAVCIIITEKQKSHNSVLCVQKQVCVVHYANEDGSRMNL